MARRYNFIYKQLVEKESDILGNIAYSLYKADKIKFIEDFKAKNGGKEPTEADFQPFHDFCCMKANIERYKKQSIEILQGFLDDTLSTTAKQIEDDLEHNFRKELSEITGKVTGKSFCWNVLQNIVGAFAFMLIMCLLVFLLKFSENQYTFTIGGSGSAKLEVVKSTPNDTIVAPVQQKK